LKRLYKKSYQTDELPSHATLACGAISSFTGQLVTYPIALIKTRRQGQIVPLPNMDQSKAHPLLSANQMCKEIWHNEGLTGFYRGIVPNMLKVIPAMSISYAVYEAMLKAISS
jgi:solute carrier family 25 (mitochondrial phosphate transporter), member 23/24/25/41